jgi:hypothetical protein
MFDTIQEWVPDWNNSYIAFIHHNWKH